MNSYTHNYFGKAGIGIIVGIADEGLGERAVEQQEEGIDLWTFFCSGLETRRPAGSIRQRATTNLMPNKLCVYVSALEVQV